MAIGNRNEMKCNRLIQNYYIKYFTEYFYI